MFSTVLFSVTLSPTMLHVAAFGAEKVVLRVSDYKGCVFSVYIEHGMVPPRFD